MATKQKLVHHHASSSHNDFINLDLFFTQNIIHAVSRDLSPLVSGGDSRVIGPVQIICDTS